MNPGGFSSFGSGGFGGSTSTSLFGSTQPAQSSIFGAAQPQAAAAQPQQSSLFSGGGFGGFGATQAATPTAVQSGTTIKFAAPSGQDSINKNGSAQTINTNHQCITAMKDYKLKSLEELRFEDYSANRKTATTQSTFGSTASTGLFGSSTTPAATTPSGFGGSNLFGGSTAAQSTANRPLLFGGSTTTASPTSTSLFGQTAQPATAQRSFFGQTAAPAAVTTTGFGGFGAAAQPAATTSVFGGAQQSSSIFGGLGQTSTAAVATPSTGLFGSTTATTAATTGGIFGQQAAKPAFGGFGATTAAPAPQQSSPFSFNAQPAVATTATPSIFGQTAANTSLTAKPAGFGGFGASTTGFGAAAQPAATGGIFGSTTVKPAFGAATTQPATTGFGGFGATAQPATGGGIFGGFGLATAQPQVAVSPFGAAQPATGGFGSTFGQTQQATTGGLFGATAQAQPAAAATIGGIFGGGQTAGGFGSGLTGGFGATTGTTLGGTTGATGGIFGSTAAQPQATSQFNLGGAPGGSFLTGNTSLTGGFGSGLTGTTQNTSGFGGLNTSQQQLQQQQGLQQQKLCQSYQDQPLVQQQISALSNSPYGSTYHLMKKEEIFNPVSPLAQRQYITDATSPVKLTSILSTGITSDVKGGLSQSIKITPKPLSTISLNKKTDLFEGLEDEEAPCFYPRKNIKKLLFKPTCQNISNTSGRSSPSNSITGGDHKIDFMRKSTYQIENENVGLGRFNQTNDYSTNNYNQGQPDSTNISEDGHINGGDSHSEGSNQPGMIQHPANIILERPGYFTIPSMQELASMTDKNGDCLVENFSIGRVDYGCITFPMVTNIANMNLDEIVHIRRKEVHVYPDETKKPPQGQGLNKTAEVTLHRIWPTDKETKKPTTDPNRIINMGYNKKIEKATVEMGAQFIDYDPTTGSWTFKVKHFSKYGLHDSDDDDDTMGGGVELVGIHSTHNPIKACNAASNFLTKEHGAMNQGNEMDIKQEKDMIQRQLKLIETRRLELMQSKQKSENGNNLNTITNQQWEMLNEYAPQNGGHPSKPYHNDNALHLELSEDSQILTTTDDEDNTEKRSTASSEQPMKKTLRKALILDNDNETDDTENDFDKENTTIFPNISEFRKNKKLSKKTDRIFPNLNKFNQSEVYSNNKDFNYQKMDQNTNYHHPSSDTLMNENDSNNQINGLPFVVASSNDRMLASTRANKTLMKAFFGEEQATEDYMNMLEEDTKSKIASLVQKPQQFSLLKRGLGGLSNEELMDTTKSVSHFKREPLQFSKPSKITAMSLTEADVQQRIGSKNLKPKKFNKYSTVGDSSLQQQKLRVYLTKHSNTAFIESIDNDANQLRSLKLNEKKVDDDSEHPFKYIKLENSIMNNMQSCIADAALFQSRRFKVNWSFDPTACTYTTLSLNLKMTDLSRVNLSTPLMAYLGNAPIYNENYKTKLSVVKENCENFLKIQLELSDSLDTTSKSGSSNLLNAQRLKLFRSKPGNLLIRNCSDSIKEMRNNIGDHPDADNIEHMKSVWSLCQNLWGDIPDNYKIERDITQNNTSDMMMNDYEREQIRKRLLSEWLADVSAHRIERECKMYKYHKNKDNHLKSIFSMLTGNRLLDACKLAADCQDYRLALLLAQSSGGNENFRNMVKKQIKEWLISGTDKYLNTDRLKYYVLIAGDLTLNSESETQIVNICENLDWKRQYGLHLWYNCLPINSIHDSLNLFEKSLSNSFCNKPLPPYLEDSVSTSTTDSTNNTLQNNNDSKLQKFGFDSSQKTRDIYDTCFHLIKLYCDEKYPIADIISPLSHTSNQLDHRLSWHLAMALCSLNFNFISKECLEVLHESYATQLQSYGLWHWSIFVLMHIDDEKRREKCVKNYLSRYVTSESVLNVKEKFLMDMLSVPSEWIYGFKALRAKYEHLHDNQFKLLIKAHQWNEAHSVLIELLAPDLFIQGNLKTLNEYLISLSKESESINKWNLGGQIYLDFIRLNQKAQTLFDFTEEQNEQKLIGAEVLKEINDKIINLSARIKELKDLDCSTEKKILVCIQISKMLLNFFNILIELNSNELNLVNEEELCDESDVSSDKKLTKLMCEKALKMTESIPYHEIIQTMIMIKTKHTRTYLMSFRPY